MSEVGDTTWGHITGRVIATNMDGSMVLLQVNSGIHMWVYTTEEYNKKKGDKINEIK